MEVEYMEFWSLYDENLNMCVMQHNSMNPIPKGLYHLSVEVWPFDGQRFFLTQRSMSKRRYPGCWECTGGSALSKENFIEAAVREVQEELGILTKEDDYTLLATEVKDKHIVSVFLLAINKDYNFDLSEKEIESGKWYTLQELESLHLDSHFVPFQFDRYLKYVRNKAFDSYLINKPKSISNIVATHPELSVPKRGLPDLGRRPDGAKFSGLLERIASAFDIYGDTLYTKKTKLPETINNSLGGGSPLLAQPFPPVVKAINELLKSTGLSQYAFPASDINCRRLICDYLHKEGFSNYISPDNIIFTESTTHAFHMILKLIIQPGDVVLFTAPTYGLFAFEPERCGGNTRFFALKSEDNWLVNPKSLAEAIDSINQELSGYECEGHVPKVVAYFQENPHNPLGKVMGYNDKELVKKIAQVCRVRDVLLIDDLLYRDLCYDRNNLAMPAAHFDEEYQNVVSLLGLSKAYGLAGIRSGIIVADEVIIRGIRNSIFQNIDSTSHLNAVALAAAFNCSSEREEAYDLYFKQILERYIFNLNLVKTAVNGIDSLAEIDKEKILAYIDSELCIDDRNLWLQPIPDVDFVKGTLPESGFFCLLDFSAYKGSKIGNTVITDDLSLLDYLFSQYRVNFITGRSMGWPNEDEIIARISFSYEPAKLVRVFLYIKKELLNLERRSAMKS